VSQKTQDLAATWQGTLGPGQGRRVVIQITAGTQGEYRALFYDIDRRGDAVPGRAIPLDGSTVKMTFTMVDGTYVGHLAPDGKSIAGTWSQNSAPMPLNLTRAVTGAEWVIPTPALKPRAMDPDADPAFEVATIKSSNPEEHRKFFRLRPDRLEGVNETVADMITFSYGVHRKQVVDAPAWIESEKFDISAKPDAEGMPSLRQWKTMVQKLLTDRFKLSFHRDQRELAVYVLSVGPAGAKLAESQGDAKGLPGIGFQRRMGDLGAFNVSMADFINFMTRNAGLDRPILDRTGLTGRYDFKLSWTPDDAQWSSVAPNVPRPSDDANPAPPLYTALQEQLGLKFSAAKALAEVYVIDHLEKPSEN
jgi:bla regulator protein blaR1